MKILFIIIIAEVNLLLLNFHSWQIFYNVKHNNKKSLKFLVALVLVLDISKFCHCHFPLNQKMYEMSKDTGLQSHLYTSHYFQRNWSEYSRNKKFYTLVMKIKLRNDQRSIT